MWKVNLRVPLNERTGYGRDGLGLARTLIKQTALSLSPVHVFPPLPLDVAEMLTIDPDPPFDLSIHHLSPQELGLTQGSRDETDLAVAWSMWEFPRFTEELRAATKSRLTGYDAVVVYDETSAIAYGTLDLDIPICILQGGYEPDEWRTKDETRDWDADEFVFVLAGQLGPRKNPFAAARVVQRLADNGYNVRLKLKTYADNIPLSMLVSRMPNVDLFWGSWTQPQMQQFYAGAHCYLGPSWGEGKNLPAIEAGTSGCALVLSDCGGHRQWARPEFAAVVGGTVNEYDEMPYLMVDEEALYEACKELVEDREKARKMGYQASQILPSQMSWDRVTQDFLMLAARRFRQ